MRRKNSMITCRTIGLFALAAIGIAACGGASTEAVGPGNPAPSPAPGGLSAQSVVVAALASQTQKGLDLSGKTLEDAVKLLGDNKLKELQEKLDELTVQKTLIDEQFRVLQELNETMEGQKAQLVREKAELQRQKDLLATGLFAALATLVAAVIAAAGQFPKWRTLSLDIELKKLEILERQRALSVAASDGPAKGKSSGTSDDEDG